MPSKSLPLYKAGLGLNNKVPAYRLPFGDGGVAAFEAVHIGDRPTEDIVGANGFGVKSVLIQRIDRKLPAEIKPDYIIDSITEVIST